MNSRTYFICVEKHYEHGGHAKCHTILTTGHNLGTARGIIDLVEELEEYWQCDVWLINWKRVKNNLSPKGK